MRAPLPAARPAPRRRVRRWLHGPELPLADPGPTARTVRLPDGRLLGWDDLGDPQGIPVLWFHGFGSTRIIRHPDDGIARRLGVRLLAVDRPGIGLSSPRPGRALGDFPGDLARMADAAGLGRFAILAWSGGGPYALACASALGERVLQVGLVSAAAPIAGPDTGPYATGFHHAARGAAGVAPWIVRLAMWRWARGQRRDPAAQLDDAIAGMVAADQAILADPRFRDVMIRNAAELYRQGGRGLYDEALVMARDWGFRLSGVRVPVRIWHGELDQAVPIAMGRHLAATLPAAEGTFLPGEAHHIFLDRWEEILGEVAERSRARLPAGVA